MNLKFNLKKFITYFILVFIVAVVFQYIWSLVFNGQEFFGLNDIMLPFTVAMTISIALVLTLPDKK